LELKKYNSGKIKIRRSKMENIMINKQEILEVISQLPDKVNLEEVIEALYVLAKMQQGMKDIKKGQLITHEELKKEVKRW
jgi:hypothetical protein